MYILGLHLEIQIPTVSRHFSNRTSVDVCVVLTMEKNLLKSRSMPLTLTSSRVTFKGWPLYTVSLPVKEWCRSCPWFHRVLAFKVLSQQPLDHIGIKRCMFHHCEVMSATIKGVRWWETSLVLKYWLVICVHWKGIG